MSLNKYHAENKKKSREVRERMYVVGRRDKTSVYLLTDNNHFLLSIGLENFRQI